MKRTLLLMLFLSALSASAQNASVTFGSSATPVVISRDIYGQFAEHLGRSIYDGFYRNGHIRMDVVNALRKIRVPNLRWPGGCFADQYHWRDGIGDKSKRPTTINTSWGMVKEDNSFGTAEFLDLCRLIGCAPYIAGNVGTGTPQEMKDWIEYLNLGHPQVALWGVGNESWGCGGNMTPEYYANLYRQFAAFCPDYPGAPLRKIISGANADDYHWTEVMMKDIGPDRAYGLSVHYYTLPTGNWNAKGSATSFSEAEYVHTLKAAVFMDELLRRHEVVMDKYDSAKKLALLVDEWGVWTDVEPGTPGYAMFQQNSLRDALVAATTLNIFNNHADRVRGANLAQTVNVIHSLILTKEDQLLLTPTYHVFDLYQVHQGAKQLPIAVTSPLYVHGADTVHAVNASASQDSSGKIHVSLVNLDPHTNIRITIPVTTKKVTGRILTSGNVTDINTFDRPDKIVIRPFGGVLQKGNQLEIVMPAKSVVMLECLP